MPLKIVRNDITKMETDAIVNTANAKVCIGSGCDKAVYNAAGVGPLLEARREIGELKEGEVCLTPAFNLPAKYIIHAVSPYYKKGSEKVVEKLRLCYRRSLELAASQGFNSIAFPLISTGSFGFPREEGLRIAVDEINSFLLKSNIRVYLVVFDERLTKLGSRLNPDLEAYIDSNYVEKKMEEEYGLYGSSREFEVEAIQPCLVPPPEMPSDSCTPVFSAALRNYSTSEVEEQGTSPAPVLKAASKIPVSNATASNANASKGKNVFAPLARIWNSLSAEKKEAALEDGLQERMKHISDTFSQYLLFLIQKKGLENAEVYKKAIVDKKVFSKIKNNIEYHPQKITALCLCVGAELNLDETRDLLARAGYALSPCDKTDIIFSYFIENGIYDMIEIDIQLEEHGVPCIIA